MEEGNRHGIGHVTAHILSMVAMTVRGVMSIIETVTLTHVQVRITKIPTRYKLVPGINYRVGHKSQEDEPFPRF